MSENERIKERVEYIENIAEDRPGEALDELQALVRELDDHVAESCETAFALIRNEDLPGGSTILGDTGVIFQRLATVALVIRDEIRHRR